MLPFYPKGNKIFGKSEVAMKILEINYIFCKEDNYNFYRFEKVEVVSFIQTIKEVILFLVFYPFFLPFSFNVS